MKFNKVFVLGGTGFLGYHTIKELLNNDIKVKTLSLPPKKDTVIKEDIIPLKVWTMLNVSLEISMK